MAGTRPGGVTLVAVLAWLSGLLNIISGVLILTGVVKVEGQTSVAAWAAIIIGVITFLVSLGLFRGSNTARILTAIIFVLNIGSAIYLIVSHPGNVVTPLISGAAALIGLIFLFTGRANEFFRS